MLEIKPCSGYRWVESGVVPGSLGGGHGACVDWTAQVNQRLWPGPGRLAATVEPALPGRQEQVCGAGGTDLGSP